MLVDFLLDSWWLGSILAFLLSIASLTFLGNGLQTKKNSMDNLWLIFFGAICSWVTVAMIIGVWVIWLMAQVT